MDGFPSCDACFSYILVYLVALFVKMPVLKNFPSQGGYFKTTGEGVLTPHKQKLCITLLVLL